MRIGPAAFLHVLARRSYVGSSEEEWRHRLPPAFRLLSGGARYVHGAGCYPGGCAEPSIVRETCCILLKIAPRKPEAALHAALLSLFPPEPKAGIPELLERLRQVLNWPRLQQQLTASATR